MRAFEHSRKRSRRSIPGRDLRENVFRIVRMNLLNEETSHHQVLFCTITILLKPQALGKIPCHKPARSSKLRQTLFVGSNDAERNQRTVYGITVWRRGDERAPHKPLLALYAIARLLRSRERMIPYSEIDRELGKLLIEFGPRRQSYHPEYPFWRLQNDGLWEVSPTKGLATRSSNTDPKRSERALDLRRHNFSWPNVLPISS